MPINKIVMTFFLGRSEGGPEGDCEGSMRVRVWDEEVARGARRGMHIYQNTYKKHIFPLF